MKLIPLSGKYGTGSFAKVDDDDYERLTLYSWCMGPGGYACRYVGYDRKKNRKRIFMHKELCQTQNGLVVDHVNRDKLDNRQMNLRQASRSQNEYNKPAPRNNTSGYKGVVYVKSVKRWVAQVGFKGKNCYIGIYATKVEAAEAYNERASLLFGEFALLNDV